MIGKPYSGKPNVRFDEGELQIELLATTPALYSTAIFADDVVIRPPFGFLRFDSSHVFSGSIGFSYLAQNDRHFLGLRPESRPLIVRSR